MTIDARFDLPMAEALEFWRAKVKMSPREFYALAENYRVRAFTVSQLARADMLNEIYQSLDKALAEGMGFHAWKKAYKPLWEENGWTGRLAWRVDNIYRTNIQTAYNVGRYKQMMDVAEDRPYWQYSAVNDSRTRPTHKALHGRVYRFDSPFWDTFYPPNGFRCRCKVKTLSEGQVAARGLKVYEGNGLGELIEPPGPDGTILPARPLMPDKGFEHNPGKEAWAGLSPTWVDDKDFTPVPIHRVCPNLKSDFALKASDIAPCGVAFRDIPDRYIAPIKPHDILPGGQPPEFYARAFMAEFGMGLNDERLVNIPGTKLPVLISNLLLMDKKKWALKAMKEGRAPYMKLLARTILDPYEIWLLPQRRAGKMLTSMNFFRRYVGDDVSGFTAFTVYDMRRWSGSTAFPPQIGKGFEKMEEYVEGRVRKGLLVYRQDEWPPK